MKLLNASPCFLLRLHPKWPSVLIASTAVNRKLEHAVVIGHSLQNAEEVGWAMTGYFIS